jgi:hypothetical protein
VVVTAIDRQHDRNGLLLAMDAPVPRLFHQRHTS